MNKVWMKIGMKRRLALLFVGVLVAAFCAAAAAAEKDTLIVADQYDAHTMDPASNSLPTARACYAIYDTLLFIRDGGPAVPGLAESWEFLSDTAYKFNLRKGVKFHNGDEMKASDVRYSIMRATTDIGAEIRTYSQNVKDVEVVDDYTVILHLKEPDYSFFSTLGHNWAAVISEKATEAAGENYAMNPVGTGPFKFVSWQKGDRYVLERFDDYWGPKVKYKTLIVRSIPEPTSRTIELESGGVDIAFPIITNDIKRIEENENLVLYRVTQNSTTFMGFNMSKPPFDDVRVRKAILAALDTVGIQAAVWRGVGKTPTSILPNAVKYSIQPEVPPHKQDVELAKKLLAEAGVTTLKFDVWTNERKERVDMATIIQAQLADLGITTEIKVLEWGAFLSGLLEKSHGAFILGWANTVTDPNYAIAGLLESTAGNNYTATNDKQIDELLRKGRGVMDGPEREAIYKELQRYINETAPMIFLHNDESIAGTQKNVRGFTPSPSELHSFREVYFED
ncbi:MAG: ABC transporter substrate-binding protein [Synergistaceae bacterium]|jgi:peptide/nickel transport system substrate-binding protein|nr:ABC transporter substrate-binding protein [Synergistaceae bacterium]